MHIYQAELHVHTVLSPCAEVEMIPPLIVREALERGIELIAVTDHNSGANAGAVMGAAAGTRLHVLPGMEVQTQEEVHVLCLFDDLEQLAAWQSRVEARLPRAANNPEFFGEQFVVDETGDFIRREERLLATSTDLSFEETIAGVRALGGLAIPAHANRKAYGVMAMLGFIPPEAGVEAVEISRHLTVEEAVEAYPGLGSYAVMQGGDAHRLEELLGANRFEMEAPCVREMRMALQGREGRRFWVEPASRADN